MKNWVVTSSLAFVLVTATGSVSAAPSWYFDACSIGVSAVYEQVLLAYTGKVLKFKNNKRFAVSISDGVYTIVDDELCVNLYADTLEELQDDLNFILEDNWNTYALADDSQLASDAQKLKYKMLDLVEVA